MTSYCGLVGLISEFLCIIWLLQLNNLNWQKVQRMMLVRIVQIYSYTICCLFVSFVSLTILCIQFPWLIINPQWHIWKFSRPTYWLVAIKLLVLSLFFSCLFIHLTLIKPQNRSMIDRSMIDTAVTPTKMVLYHIQNGWSYWW